jgi:hypothetical protein
VKWGLDAAQSWRQISDGKCERISRKEVEIKKSTKNEQSWIDQERIQFL